MAHTKLVMAAGMTVVALCGGTAVAQQQVEVVETEYRVPRKTLEIGVGAGYSQGTGQITEVGERVSDVARAGGEAALDIGWRFNERWLVGGYGTFGYFRDGANVQDANTRAFSGGAQAQYHFNPLRRWDPWIGFGAGYRGIYASRDVGGSEVRHGVQLARFRVGLDLRASPGVALGPVLGVDATMFTAVNYAGVDGTRRIESDQWTIAPFFFAGLGGRFDFNTERVRRESYTTTAAAF